MSKNEKVLTLFVQYVPQLGYQVVNQVGKKYEPLQKDKYYLHVTSAYAAMGRIQQRYNIHQQGLDHDPAKASHKKDNQE